MAWVLRDTSRDVRICDPFREHGPDGLTALPREDGVAVLRWLAGDPLNADVIRDLHALRSGGAQRDLGAPPTSNDLFVTPPDPLAKTLAEVENGSLVVFVGEERIASDEVPEPALAVEPEEAEPLVSAEPRPEPAPPPMLLAQAAALQQAAERGAPFCEE